MSSELVIVHGPETSWKPDDKKYKCCCDTCHVTTGTAILGILTAVGLFLNFVSFIGFYSKVGSQFGGAFWSDFLFIFVYALVHVALFWGLRTERAGLLLPYLVYQVISMVVVGIVIIVCIINLALGGAILAALVDQSTASHAHHDKQELAAAAGTVVAMGAVLLVMFMIAEALQIWFFLVVKGCFTFFKDKDTFRNAASRGLPQSYRVTSSTAGMGVSVPASHSNGYSPVYNTPPEPLYK